MKFIGPDGRIYGKNIQEYKWSGESRSEGQRQLGEILTSILPYSIYSEVPCFGAGLYMDFYIPQISMCIEFDGKQHEEYVSFFHGSRAGYSKSVRNDVAKQLWCESNNIKLIRVNDKDLTTDTIKSKIHDATSS